jgi:ABC-type bacteriocin/lantibiotic exporter with double-glycine peptidase domain
MCTLMVIEATLSAATTYLVIQAGRDVANGDFRLLDFAWILAAQALAYIVGGVSWVFAEQAGFGAHGRYMAAFARANRSQNTLFSEKTQREQVEPFLTGETFHIFFELMYEIEGSLRLALGLVLNAIVLGVEIDGGLPVAYVLTFLICIGMQLSLRKKIAYTYLENQRSTNHLTAHCYTAWDNIFVGNRYNYRRWNHGFKTRLRAALKAQIRAIVAKEGLATIGGIVSLCIVFTAIFYAGFKSSGDTATLVALAATLPRQIDLAHDVHSLAANWNDLVAIWTRIGGAVDHFKPSPTKDFVNRIKFSRVTFAESGEERIRDDLHDALALIGDKPTGRINLRGGNGAGKSTLIAALKQALGAHAFYWPTTDRLSFQFAEGNHPEADDDGGDDDNRDLGEAVNVGANRNDQVVHPRNHGFSAGERQIRSLQEIVANTHASVYLLDEWDANLDSHNRSIAQALVDTLARRARVVEISHRDLKAQDDR